MKTTITRCCMILSFLTVLSSFSCDTTLSGDRLLTGSSAGGPELTLISWNLQEFFDAVDTGTEYEDYTGIKSAWSEDKYQARLDRLCSVIESTDADVYCFMEMENQSIIHDIANRLHLRSSRTVPFPYAAFCKGNTGSIGCAVLSRVPIENLTAHGASFKATLPVDLYTGYEPGAPMSPPVMRPLMEVTLAPFEEGRPPVKLLVNHWKSKSSGGRESELWRSTQECVLSQHMTSALEQGYPCIAVGDFNRDLNEFYWTGYVPGAQSGNQRQVVLRSLFDRQAVDSPWFTSTQKGSYYYDDDWSRIDHVFTAGSLRITSFEVLNREPFVSDSGTPDDYNVWTGKGYSDHFPLKVKIAYTNQ